MLRPLMLALLGTSFTFLMTALGAATVFFFARKVCERAQGALLGFAAGVMMAASVWSLILPAIEQTEAEGRLPPFLPAAAGIVLGALTLFLLDELVRRRGGGEVHSDFLLLSAITLHNSRSRSRRTGRALPARSRWRSASACRTFPRARRWRCRCTRRASRNGAPSGPACSLARWSRCSARSSCSRRRESTR